MYPLLTTRGTFLLSITSFFTWKIVICLLVYLNLWCFFGSAALPPDGPYFHLWSLFIVSHLSGNITGHLGLPPLLGMLIAGFTYANAFDITLDKSVTSLLRSLALAVILLRAGLSLDASLIRKLSFLCFRLAILPCALEAVTVGGAAYLAFDLPISWALLLGFVVASVSPAVLVPSMIHLQERRQGTERGIPTLVIAASSLDNVFAITGFSACLSLVFASAGPETTLLWSIFKGPTEAAGGVTFGLLVGLLLWFVPETVPGKYRKHKGSKYNLHRLLLLLVSSTFILFASQRLNLSSAGPLGILVLSFVASLRWRPAGLTQFSEQSLKTLWIVLENFLFALIAADVRLKSLEGQVVLLGVACLLLGLVFRILLAYFLTYGNGLSGKERLYLAITWIPKASVQAAIGSVALDRATSSEQVALGRLVLTLAVLSILLTAPLGAVAMDATANWLLGPGQLEQEMEEGRNSRRRKDAYQQLDGFSCEEEMPLVY